jgi:hypothetical protein
VTAVNGVLWAAGAILIVIGWQRAWGPWNRYQALRRQDENVSRYEAWRGGVRTHDDGPTGASVAIAMLRRQAQIGAAIAIIGIGLIVAGFAIK